MLKDVIEISREAGEIIRNGFGKKLDVEFKTNEANLVTQIDKKSEKIIVDFIRTKYPSHSILAEEGGEVEKKNSEYIWVIDPLDGTTNFTHNLPIFSVSIGVQKNGETIAGVVYDVMQDVVYAAEKGGGAYGNDEKIYVSRNDKIGRSLLVTGFPYNIKDNPENALEKFAALTRSSRGVRRLGSAAIDFAYVAKGVFDGFWEVYLSPWDICAGMFLVEEAGGIVTGFSGEKIDIYSKKILATNNKIHSQIIEIMQQIK